MSKELNITDLLPHMTAVEKSNAQLSLRDNTFIGIDFGTSTTVTSLSYLDENGAITVEALDLNQLLSDGAVYSNYKVSTIIAYAGNRLLVGEGGKQLKHKLVKDQNVWYSFKMDLGEDVGCKYPKSELGASHKLVTISNPTDATKLFFKYLKSQIEREVKRRGLPATIEYAVSIPASFEANQRNDLLSALEANGMGLSQQSLIDEPNAAFLSYVLNGQDTGKPIHVPNNYRPRILVFDFGAGTCDISILEIGQDVKGYYSKNIAISRFEKLGGDDVDRLIAIDVLMPQLFHGTSLSVDNFRTREVNELILPTLLPVAERLKIMVSEKVSLKCTTIPLWEMSQSDEMVRLGSRVQIDTRLGILELKEPRITVGNFIRLSRLFTEELSRLPQKRINSTQTFRTIFSPIASALKKVKLKRNDIDYVLLVGGSSKNPVIQQALQEGFQNSEVIVPKDLQAHVSAGAAIHSFVFNGYGKSIIQPITSEPIFLVTKDGYREILHPIIEAGTLIPCQLKSIEGLTASTEDQDVVEMPICVGSIRKLLHNVKLTKAGGAKFSSSDTISLQFEITADKSLLVRAVSGNTSVFAERMSPFTNSEANTEDFVRFKAEKNYNLAVQRGGGQPTATDLQSLYNAYEIIGDHLRAAETLEMLGEMYPTHGNDNNTGLHYENSGNSKKAEVFYRKSLEVKASSTTAINLYLLLKRQGNPEAIQYLEQALLIDPENKIAKYEMGIHLNANGQLAKGTILLQEAFDGWVLQFDLSKLKRWEYGYFASCARALGKDSYAKTIEEASPSRENSTFYNSDNLTKLHSAKQLSN